MESDFICCTLGRFHGFVSMTVESILKVLHGFVILSLYLYIYTDKTGLLGYSIKQPGWWFISIPSLYQQMQDTFGTFDIF